MDKMEEDYYFKRNVIRDVLEGDDLDDAVMTWVEEDLTNDGLEDSEIEETENGWIFKFSFLDDENSSYSSGFDKESGPWSELHEQAYIRVTIEIDGNDIFEEEDGDNFNETDW